MMLTVIRVALEERARTIESHLWRLPALKEQLEEVKRTQQQLTPWSYLLKLVCSSVLNLSSPSSWSYADSVRYVPHVSSLIYIKFLLDVNVVSQ
jgi:hypothetical protein